MNDQTTPPTSSSADPNQTPEPVGNPAPEPVAKPEQPTAESTSEAQPELPATPESTPTAEVQSNPVAPTPTPTPPEPVTPAPAAPIAREPTPAPTPTEPVADDSTVISGAPSQPGDKPDTENIHSEPVAGPHENQQKSESHPIFPETSETPATGTSEALASPPTPAADVPPDGKRHDGTDLDKGEKLLAGIGYIGILALIPLLLRRDSEYCRHHGPQALVIFVIIMLVEIFSRLVGFVAPGFHAFILILMLVAWITGFALAFRGQWFRVPVIFGWSRQLDLFAKEASQATNKDGKSDSIKDSEEMKNTEASENPEQPQS